jgi:hypothetical protein
VNQRARRLNGEYLRKAKNLDQKFNGTAGGVVGPVEQPPIVPAPGQLVQRLVFGAFGDASPDFDVLVQATATTGARKHWQKMQCKSPTEAFGIIVWKIRKLLGVAMIRWRCRRSTSRRGDTRLIASGQGSASKVLIPTSPSAPYSHHTYTPRSARKPRKQPSTFAHAPAFRA